MATVEATQSAQSSEARPLAHYHPTVWGDFFITNYSLNNEEINLWKQQVKVLKEEARKIITTNSSDNLSQTLSLIDVVQRLGLGNYFEVEIEKFLSQIFNTYQDNIADANLQITSLCFRLLRQWSFNASADVFKKFMDDKCSFKQDLVEDVQGLLSLYEASFFSVHGENILDEAQEFTRNQLESVLSSLRPSLAKKVKLALKRPILKGVTRHEAWHFISMYEEEEGYNETLLRLAKLEFNVVQKLHQEELHFLERWWRDLDIATKLPFARDRLVEAYFWPLGVFFDSKYSIWRRILGKLIALFIVIDDIYDALFTEAIERWDEVNMKDQLPEYMQVCYQALRDLFMEIEKQVAREGRSYCMVYAKKALKNLIRAYITEARWFRQNYVACFEEHMSIVLISCCYQIFMTISIIGFGEIATKEVFDWLLSKPKVFLASSTICRLMGDLVSCKFERIRGHVASTIDCYVKQYGVSEEEACKELGKRVTSAWKDINEELLKPTVIPRPVLTLILDFARVMDVVYKEEDGITFSHNIVRDALATLLINPFTI